MTRLPTRHAAIFIALVVQIIRLVPSSEGGSRPFPDIRPCQHLPEYLSRQPDQRL
jgi:hypothetical protein